MALNLKAIWTCDRCHRNFFRSSSSSQSQDEMKRKKNKKKLLRRGWRDSDSSRVRNAGQKQNNDLRLQQSSRHHSSEPLELHEELKLKFSSFFNQHLWSNLIAAIDMDGCNKILRFGYCSSPMQGGLSLYASTQSGKEF